MYKRLLSILLAVCMVVSALPAMALVSLAAEGDLPTTMTVEPTEANALPAAIKLYKTSSTSSGGGWGGWPGIGGGTTTGTTSYNLYLPGDVDASQCFFTWADGLQGTVDGSTYASGAMPVPAPGEKKTYTFTKGSETATFEVTCYQGSETVPVIFIEIDETQGTISAMNSDPDHETTCTGQIYVDGAWQNLKKIKGRGNASWSMAKEKRGYNMTLDTKQVLLGLDANKTKKYSLVPNIDDPSLLKCKVGFDMAHAMGIGQDSINTDVWMNGEYLGTYLLTPKTDSYVSADGYCLENDNYKEPTLTPDNIDVADPSFDLDGLYPTDSQASGSSYNRISVKAIGSNVLGTAGETYENLVAITADIKDYMQDALNALLADDGMNDKGKYYTEYWDVETWAKMYLMHEYVKSFDVNAGSILFHRDGTTESDPLFAGPLWDLGNAMGSCQSNSLLGGQADRRGGWGAFIPNIADENSSGSGWGVSYKTSILKKLWGHDDFKVVVKNMYNQYRSVFDNAPAAVSAYYEEIKASGEMNLVRTSKETYDDMVATYNSDTVVDSSKGHPQTYVKTDSYKAYCDNLKTYCTARSEFFASDECGFADENYVAPIVATFKTTGATITTYDTQDMTTGGTPNAKEAYARDSVTGEIVTDGSGQVNFVVVPNSDWQVESVTVEPAENFKNLKGPADTGVENGYRITKVTGPITITVVASGEVCEHDFDDTTGECKFCGEKAFKATYVTDGHATVTAYDRYEGTAPVEETARPNVGYSFARDGSTGAILIDGEGQVSFVVTVQDGYKLDSIEPVGTFKNFKLPEETGTDGYYRITKVKSDLTITIKTSKLGGSGGGSTVIDFTNPEDASKFEIVNNTNNIEIAEGVGLTLTTTRPAFEPCGGQNSGDQATNPEEVVEIPVSGDWTATLTVDFSTGSARNGWYQFFGFYASMGDDYQNMAGIRGGDGAMQDFLRVDGTITADTTGVKSEPGFATAGTYYLQLVKECTTYTALRSDDGETFTEMFKYEDTGIEATKLVIDAYTGMTTGYQFTLKSLNLLGGAECEHDYQAGEVTAPTCTEKGYTTYTCTKCGDSYIYDETPMIDHTIVDGKCSVCGMAAYTATFVCDAHATVTAYDNQQITLEGHPNATTAYARSSADGRVDGSGSGQVNFVVNVASGYELDTVTAEPAESYKNFKQDPEADGSTTYFRATKVVGDFTVTVTTKKIASGSALESIDFTNPDDASKFEIVNNTNNIAIAEGVGLTLTTTRPAFEPCNGQNSGDQATNPEEVVEIPVAGDWTATLTVDFSTGSASNGYYQFFGFYAAEGEGYGNLAGIRGGDGAMQDLLRIDGADPTAETMNSQPGFATAGTYYLQLVKEGTTYTALRSDDGETFTEMFKFEDTGIEAEKIVIDAYTGMTTGYQFTLKALDFEGGAPACEHKNTEVRNAKEATCTAEGYTGDTYCKDCGKKIATGNTIEKNPHNYVDGVCTVCGAEENCQHNYVAKTVAPTCTEAGYTLYTCTKCGDSYKGGGNSGTFTDVEIIVDCPTTVSSKQNGVTYVTPVKKQYYSTVSGKTKGVNIQVPANYTTDKQYPVIYVLHGIGGNEDSMVNYATHFSNMMADGTMPEAIIVYPDMFCGTGSNMQFDQETMAKYDLFADDMKTDLMPFIKENYSILEGRENTAVCGFSMGGRETITVGLKIPELVGYLGAFAPAPGVVPGKDMFMEHAGTFTEDEVKFDPAVEPYLFLICCGTNDQVVGTFPQQYHELFDTNGVKHNWWTIQGSGHGDPATSSGIYNFGRYVFKNAGTGGEEIPALGHTEEIRNAKEATCGTAGYTGDTYCKTCGEKLAEGEVIPATGEHKWGDWAVTTPAGVLTDGVETRKCSVCGETETRAIPATGFEDVTSDHYYYKAVMWAAGSGITTGTNDTHFSPDKDCTRAQAVMFLWNAAGKPEVAENVTNPFTDVKADRYYYKAVLWAVSKGITTGTTATTFSPNAKLDRATFVTFLWRAMGKKEATSTGKFTDVKDGKYYAKAIAWAVSEGITAGTTSTTFAPAELCTRAQVVTFLQRAYAE